MCQCWVLIDLRSRLFEAARRWNRIVQSALCILVEYEVWLSLLPSSKIEGLLEYIYRESICLRYECFHCVVWLIFYSFISTRVHIILRPTRRQLQPFFGFFVVNSSSVNVITQDSANRGQFPQRNRTMIFAKRICDGQLATTFTFTQSIINRKCDSGHSHSINLTCTIRCFLVRAPWQRGERGSLLQRLETVSTRISHWSPCNPKESLQFSFSVLQSLRFTRFLFKR